MRRRRNRATWFPILGFNTGAAAATGDSTVDARKTSVSSNGAPNVIIIPIIPDVDLPVEQGQGAGTATPVISLRDFVEGQSCIIERIVGTIQVTNTASAAKAAPETIAVCAAIAVIPVVDDGSGNPAISVDEIDPLRADNSAQPWLWRRVWVLGDELRDAGGDNNPTNNLFGSVAEGCKIDTKGTKRAIRREERIFLIFSFLNMFPSTEGESRTIQTFADLRVIGRMVRAHNRSSFK